MKTCVIHQQKKSTCTPVISSRVTITSILSALLGICLSGSASAAMFSTDKFSIYGDFRSRIEKDFDSQTAGGASREDRLRARIRLRLGFSYKHNANMEMGLRLRSGSDDSQQSPHITVIDFDDNDTGDADFNYDKYFLKGKKDNTWGWIGRNSLPIWKPNELFWDDDVTPAGIAAGINMKAGDNATLGINAGFFSLPAGMQDYCGDMFHVQAVLKSSKDNSGFTAAAGLFNISAGNPADADCGIYNSSNGARDYSIIVLNLQAKMKSGDKPLAAGIDIMTNNKDYSLAVPGVNAGNQNEKDGWDVYAKYGGTKNKGDMLLGYWYANIEQFAVNNSFSQDDWVRWGSATQTRASNMKGHEFRFAYGMGDGMNAVARLYIVEAATGSEDGNRFRIDLNQKF